MHKLHHRIPSSEGNPPVLPDESFPKLTGNRSGPAAAEHRAVFLFWGKNTHQIFGVCESLNVSVGRDLWSKTCPAHNAGDCYSIVGMWPSRLLRTLRNLLDQAKDSSSSTSSIIQDASRGCQDASGRTQDKIYICYQVLGTTQYQIQCLLLSCWLHN